MTGGALKNTAIAPPVQIFAQSMEQQAYPLCWPDGWVRTRPQNRRFNNPWKKGSGAYRDELIDELERLGAIELVISTNVPLTIRGLPRADFSPPDPGVAVFFKRKPRNDFQWQDVLELQGQITFDHVESQFKKLAKKYHTDIPGTGDPEMIRLLLHSRNAAHDYVLGRNQEGHNYSLACDVFREVRLNLHAIGLTVEAMRQMERCGASTMLERAFRGFQAALPAHASSELKAD